MNPQKKAVMLLSKIGLMYCDPSTANVYTHHFLDTSVKDMDVVNQDSLNKEILGFVQQNNLLPAEITVIVAKDSIFERRVPKEELEKLQEVVPLEIEKRFADVIPFETVLSKNFTEGSEIAFYAVNGELVNCIIQTLQSLGSLVENVYPVTIPELRNLGDLTVQSAETILNKSDSLRAYNLLKAAKPQDFSQPLPEEKGKGTSSVIMPKPQKNSKRVYVLLIVFGVLFAVLIYMVVKNVL